LERALELNDPGIVGQSQDVSLGSHMSNLVLVDHLLLLHLLDGDNLIGLPISADSHLTKGSSTDDLLWDEILDRNLGPLQPIIF